MRIVVVGAGGVGGYFGARMAAGRHDVTFVARGAHLEAMRRDGLKIISPMGDLRIARPQLAASPAEIAGNVDLVIVAVKMWDLEAVAQSIAPLVRRGASVVSFQNGVTKDETLARFLPPDSIFGGAAYTIARIAEPGVIHHDGILQRLVFGEYDGIPSARVRAFHRFCENAGIHAEISHDIGRAIWEKFVVTVGLTGATSVIRQPIGAVRTNPRGRAFLLDIMREAVAVGRARCIDLRRDFAEDRLTFCDTLPIDTTSSMYTDLERHRRLEVPWLSGYVAELGAQLGISVPRNQAIAEILSIYETTEQRELDDFALMAMPSFRLPVYP